jgi:hypothetical protein
VKRLAIRVKLEFSGWRVQQRYLNITAAITRV